MGAWSANRLRASRTLRLSTSTTVRPSTLTAGGVIEASAVAGRAQNGDVRQVLHVEVNVTKPSAGRTLAFMSIEREAPGLPAAPHVNREAAVTTSGLPLPPTLHGSRADSSWESAHFAPVLLRYAVQGCMKCCCGRSAGQNGNVFYCDRMTAEEPVSDVVVAGIGASGLTAALTAESLHSLRIQRAHS